MKKLWNILSNLGIDEKTDSLAQKSNILINQINSILLFIMVCLFIALRIEGTISHGPMGFGSYRVLLIIVILIVNLWLAYHGHFILSKFSLIYLTPAILFLLPTFYGFVEEESFIYYPYGLIALSIIPQLLLSLTHNKSIYFLSLAYYLLLLLIIDFLLNLFNPTMSDIFKLIKPFYFYYKLIPVVIFVFTATSVYYLRRLNFKYYAKLEIINQQLDNQNEELKTTINNLKLTQNQLIQAEKMAALGNLTAGISHEINNPLNYITGGVFFIEEALEKIALKPDNIETKQLAVNLSKSIEMINSGIKKASQIVSLLTVFSIDQKREKQDVNLNEIINGTICFISLKTNDKVAIIRDFNYDGKVNVYYDQVHQVLLNIFNNALDAIYATHIEEPFLKISTYCEVIQSINYVIIEIFNTGTAIEYSKLQTIFEPFYSTKETNDRVGLGLTVAYNIIKNHKGLIEAFNRENGVVIKVGLPLNQGNNEEKF